MWLRVSHLERLHFASLAPHSEMFTVVLKDVVVHVVYFGHGPQNSFRF